MLSIIVGGGWSTARPASARARATPWGTSLQRGHAIDAAWQQAQQRELATAGAWGTPEPADASKGQQWGTAPSADGELLSGRWDQVPAKDSSQRLGWDRTLRPHQVVLRLIYNPKPSRHDSSIGSPVRRVDEFGRRRDALSDLQGSLYLPGVVPLAFNFGGRPYFPSSSPLVFFDFRYTEPSYRIQPVDSGGIGARWQSARRVDLRRRLPWGKARMLDGALTGIDYEDYPGPVKPLPEPPPDPEILDTYMIANIVTVVALPSRTPIEAKSIRLSLDADAYSWAFSADILTQAAMDLVRPDADGAKEIEVNINGWVWVLLVERYNRTRKFPTEAYSVSGSTRSQLLAAPYAPLRSGLNSAAITARQAAEEQLLNTGFTLVWEAETVGPVDWTFPAGAFSYQSQTAIQVITRIAATVGAIVRPARDSDQLTVLPRYPVPSWEFNTIEAPITCIIPLAMMTDLAGEWTPQPAWNACYVSGTSHGVSMLVRRRGTAGDNPAPDVVDDWLTGQEANQARGTHEISKGGNISIEGCTIPLFPNSDDHGVGLVLPGQLCRVPEESGSWDGLCLSVEINAAGTGASKVTQNLKLERHY